MSSPDPARPPTAGQDARRIPSRRAAAGAVVDVAAVPARLPLRARADGRRLRARARRRGARRAAGGLVQAARRGADRAQAGLLRFAVMALAVSAVATWLLQTVSTRLQRRFRDKVTIALESHVARLQASIATIAHQERPEYLDRLSVLREQIFTLDHMYMSVFSTAGWLAAPGHHRGAARHGEPGAGDRWSCSRSRRWRPRPGARSWSAPPRSAARRPTASPGTCSRCPPPPRRARNCGCSASARTLAGRRRAAWERWYGPVAAARAPAPPPGTRRGWAVFALAYVGAIALVATGPHASPAAAILVLTAGARLSSYVGATVSEIGFLRGIWMDGSRRLAWLEDYAARGGPATPTCPRRTASPTASGSSTSRSATRERTAPALHDVSLFLPGRSGGGHRRRERGRQVHAGQAAGQALRPGLGPHPGRRHGPGPHRLGAMAGAHGRRVPGLLPLRVPGRADDRPRRPAAARRRACAARAPPDRAGARDVIERSAGRPATPSSGPPGTTASTSPTASGRSSPWPAGSCATSR